MDERRLIPRWLAWGWLVFWFVFVAVFWGAAMLTRAVS